VTPAIVLRTTPVGESDLIVTLLTASHGRVDARANGARKSKRRFPGGLPMAARGFATLATGRGMPRLEGFEATHDAQALGRDLEAFAYAAYGCELALELVEGAMPDPRAFAALAEYLADVLGEDQGSEHGLGRTPWAMRRFELRLLEALGFIGAFDRCAVCGTPLPEWTSGSRVAFDRSRGGPLCVRHAGSAASVEGWALHTADRLRGVLLASVEGPEALGHGSSASLTADLVSASEGARRGLRDLVAGIVRAHLRRPLRSAEFFAQLQSTAKRAPASVAVVVPAAQETAHVGDRPRDSPAHAGRPADAPAVVPTSVPNAVPTEKPSTGHIP
jgi:DNA repair protein RecO (recombination protein O)